MPKLPSIDLAVVPNEKIVGYLLSQDHPHGRAKCRYLEGFGFRATAWEVLHDALVAHAQANEIADTRQSGHGVSYGIDGPLQAPDGRTPDVRVVWFIRTGEQAPRLVTLVPRRMRGS